MIPAIICARGGSKRIPRKNIKPFCGKPLIAWTIEAARSCKYVHDVYVSTDDDEIADVAYQYGAQVMRRDWVSQDDEIGMVPFVKALDNLGHKGLFLSLLPTWTCRRRGDLDAMVELQQKGTYYQTLFAYNPKETLIWKKLQNGGAEHVLFDKDKRYYAWSAGDCCISAENYRENYRYVVEHGEGFMPAECGIIPIQLWQCHDIDDMDDFETAEYWFKRKMIDVHGKDPYAEHR
jgi:CMP-N-acetylneuraminic acid synthetase